MKTLLLNNGYEPIRLISWKRAITLHFLGKGDILDFYEAPLRSRFIKMKMPAVIRLRRYHRCRERVKLSRENIYARDQYKCQYCGEEFNSKDLTLDHIHPESRGGKNSWLNLVACCGPCNNKKDNRTPKEASMPLLRKPFVPRWMPAVLVKAIRNKEIPKQWLPWIQWIHG